LRLPESVKKRTFFCLAVFRAEGLTYPLMQSTPKSKGVIRP